MLGELIQNGVRLQSETESCCRWCTTIQFMLTPNYSLNVMLNSWDYYFPSIISRVNTHPSLNYCIQNLYICIHSICIYRLHVYHTFKYMPFCAKITYKNFLAKWEHLKTLFYCCVELLLEHIIWKNYHFHLIILILPYFSFPTPHLGLCLEEQIGLDLQFWLVSLH